MQRTRSWLFIVAAILVIGLVSAGAALAGPPRQGPVGTPPAVVPVGGGTGPSAGNNAANGTASGIQDYPSGQFPYQGKLILDGNPYNGNIDITFSLYSTEVGGTAWYSETQNVAVTDGLFNVMIGAVNPLTYEAEKFGYQQWLGIQPAGAANELAPRSLLGVAPYAMGLVPGTSVYDHNPGTEPYVRSFYVWADNHPAIYGGSGVSHGVYGVSTYTGTGAIGVIGWHAADTGTEPGVYGGSYSTNSYATGVVGHIVPTSPGGYSAAVRGINEGVGGLGIGVWGSQRGSGWGVYGETVSGLGVYGWSSSGTGVYGATYTGTAVLGTYGSAGGTAAAVQGVSYSTTDFAVGVLGNMASGSPGYDSAAVSGQNEGLADAGIGVRGRQEGNGWGISGIAFGNTGGVGARGYTGDAGGNYGLYTPQNLYSLNYNLMGAIRQVVQNTGSEPLEAGDVVVFSGIGAPLADGRQVVQVAKAQAANSTAVAGVVLSRYNAAAVETVEGPDQSDSFRGAFTLDGPAAPGDYLLIVVQGPAQVKVAGAVSPGDLLSTAGLAGYAARAAEVDLDGVRAAIPGTVLGKALEAVESGERTIYVFVTLK